ncbi:PLP-dependent transferase [uncultured Polaribacter sp.]|uniref:PLP-dependent transferase n=1 Tax=uncultured Polaribacter sp. TaxID=174711 RepID=UPI0026047B85|nr:PLP-dependent transferase [uncultured Polaribacter sp.]
MKNNTVLNFTKNILNNMPTGWLETTTHRLDIYNEKLAKTEFLTELETLFKNENTSKEVLQELPTAYDYIRLGHPLSCLLEWTIAKTQQLDPENIICFSSKTMPILAILRANLLQQKNTKIYYLKNTIPLFEFDKIKNIYGYQFEVVAIENTDEITPFNGTTLFISESLNLANIKTDNNINFYITSYATLGSILIANSSKKSDYISEIQHVRRRETIAMTPINTHIALQSLINSSVIELDTNTLNTDKANVTKEIQKITSSDTSVLVGSSGLSIQFAIVMGLIDDAIKNYPDKKIKIVVPTNCYGGTNDQARRIAACVNNVSVVDLAVDGKNNMVKSIDIVLSEIAKEDAIPFIIAEIPTNPRVEVPNLMALKEVLAEKRKTVQNTDAIAPVFILDQTFCPNVHFLRDHDILAPIKIISYASGSKFPSGGICTAGYCIANKKANYYMPTIENHLQICDNEATELQYQILAKQLPSMNNRIIEAYKNTRSFVTFIKENLPTAKINFVSDELAAQGFTPSVFSLDLPTKGNTNAEKEAYKRRLNNTLINLMIDKIPHESKYCVSYGQLNGCYWTIPATSTQGTTKEGDKDYIARVALSANMDLNLHKEVFLEFVKGL